jgi:hypothetical protein
VTLRSSLAWVRAGTWALFLCGLPLSTSASPVPSAIESGEDCIARATIPLPTCTPPETPEERQRLALDRAAASIEKQDWSAAVQILSGIEQPVDYGARVRLQALLGVASSELNDPRADEELEQALTAWAAPESLAWIRDLPVGEASARLVQRTYDAVASAAFQRAELARRRTIKPLPSFPRAAETPPFAPRPDAALTPTERRKRDTWRSSYRAALQEYVRNVFAPWARRQRQLIALLQREYEEVHFVAPGATPEWRVAVAARVGTLWGDFSVAQSSLDAATRSAHDADELPGAYYGTFDDPWEPDRQLARSAFEKCVELSRKHRILTHHTLVCEAWLGRNYRFEHRQLDEFMPLPHRWPSSSVPPFAPISLAPPASPPLSP